MFLLNSLWNDVPALFYKSLPMYIIVQLLSSVLIILPNFTSKVSSAFWGLHILLDKTL